jgi:hypothetical protein
MTRILRLLAITFALACVIGLVILLIGWLLHWNSTTQWSNGFFGAGAILIVFGLLTYWVGLGCVPFLNCCTVNLPGT